MFNLSFLNSIALFGLISAIIPLIIHLFVKHRPKIIYFSSLRFIKEIQKAKSRVIKLREIILLIIRILIILLFIMAISRPVLRSLFPSKSWKYHAPTAAVLIIDNSLSMNYLDKKETFFDKAKSIGLEISSMLNNKDKVMLLCLNKNYNQRNSYFFKPNQLPGKIQKLFINDNNEPAYQVASKAEKELERIDVINKEIYFITDNQEYVWKDIKKLSDKIQTDIFVIPVPKEDSSEDNIAVLSALYLPSLLTQKHNPQIKASIKNFSSQSANNEIVSLILNNITRAEKVISLSPYQSKEVIFDLQKSKEKNQFGAVSVKDKKLPDDNSFYFNFSEEDLPKISIITNQEIPFQFSAALDLITHNNWTKSSPQNLSEHLIEKNQLFIIYKLEVFTEKMSFYLNKILENNKSLMLIATNELKDNPALKQWLKKRGIFYSSIENRNTKIDFINKLHPLCSVFTKDMFNLTNIYKVWKIEAPSFNPLISTKSNLPLFLIKNKFLLSTIDFTPEWSNLVYQTVFPVWIYNIGIFLGEKGSTLSNYTVGVPFEIKFEGNLEIHLPTGKNIPVAINEKENKFTETDQQGQYFLFDNDKLLQVFSCNANRDESNLKSLSIDAQKNIVKEIKKIHFLTNKNWNNKILTSRYGYELWKILLWIVFALIVVEMILSYSGKKTGIKHEK